MIPAAICRRCGPGFPVTPRSWKTGDRDRPQVPRLECRDLRPCVGIVWRQFARRDCARNRRENRFRFHPVPRLVNGGPAAHGRRIVRPHCNLPPDPWQSSCRMESADIPNGCDAAGRAELQFVRGRLQNVCPRTVSRAARPVTIPSAAPVPFRFPRARSPSST